MDHPATPPMLTRAQWLWLAGVTLLALALRLYRLGEQSLWWDDYNGVAHLTIPGFWASLADARRMNPEGAPLYHVAQWFASFVFGAGEYGQRLFNVLLSTATVPVVFLVGRNAFGAAAGLVGAMLFALSPEHIYHAQSLRIYPLEVLLAALSLLAFERMLATGSTRWRWMNVVCNGLLPVTHLMGLFAVIAQGTALLGLGPARWGLLIRWSTLQLVCLVPMVIVVAAMPHRPAGAFWHFNHPTLSDIAFDLFGDDVHNPPGALVEGASGRNTPWSIRVAGFDSHAPGTRRAFDVALMGAMAAVAALAVSRLAFLSLPRRFHASAAERRNLWVMLACWAVPVFALAALCYLWRPVMHYRYTLYACLGLYLLAGHVIAVCLPGRAPRRAAVAALAALVGYQLLALLPVNTRTEWREVARDIAREAGPDDIVLVGAFGPPDINHRTFCYHLPAGFDAPVLPSGTVLWTLEQTRCHLRKRPPQGPVRAVWFVYNTHFYLGDPEAFHASFLEHGLAFERRHYAGGETIIVFRIVDWPDADADAPLEPRRLGEAPHRARFDVDLALDMLELPLPEDQARRAVLRAWDSGSYGEGRQACLVAFRHAFAQVEEYALSEHCGRKMVELGMISEVENALMDVGVAFVPTGRLDRVVDAFLTASASGPLPPEARAVLAYVLLKSGDGALARQVYEAARDDARDGARLMVPLLDALFFGDHARMEAVALELRRTLVPHGPPDHTARVLGLPPFLSPCHEPPVITPITPGQRAQVLALLERIG